MKIDFKKLVFCVGIPLIVGALSAAFSMSGMMNFETIPKPPLTPPGWIFPIVWTILFALMGIASYIVSESNVTKAEKESALRVYAAQLFFNFFWSIWFFRFNLYAFSFVWLVILWILILVTTVKFFKISKTAGYLMIPYLLWVTFAGYLNLGIAYLELKM